MHLRLCKVVTGMVSMVLIIVLLVATHTNADEVSSIEPVVVGTGGTGIKTNSAFDSDRAHESGEEDSLSLSEPNLALDHFRIRINRPLRGEWVRGPDIHLELILQWDVSLYAMDRSRIRLCYQLTRYRDVGDGGEGGHEREGHGWGEKESGGKVGDGEERGELHCTPGGSRRMSIIHIPHTGKYGVVMSMIEDTVVTEIGTRGAQVLPTLSYSTLPYPTLPYPTLPYPTLSYPYLYLSFTYSLPYLLLPTLPYPTLPYPQKQIVVNRTLVSSKERTFFVYQNTSLFPSYHANEHLLENIHPSCADLITTSSGLWCDQMLESRIDGRWRLLTRPEYRDIFRRKVSFLVMGARDGGLTAARAVLAGAGRAWSVSRFARAQLLPFLNEGAATMNAAVDSLRAACIEGKMAGVSCVDTVDFSQHAKQPYDHILSHVVLPADVAPDVVYLPMVRENICTGTGTRQSKKSVYGHGNTSDRTGMGAYGNMLRDRDCIPRQYQIGSIERLIAYAMSLSKQLLIIEGGKDESIDSTAYYNWILSRIGLKSGNALLMGYIHTGTIYSAHHAHTHTHTHTQDHTLTHTHTNFHHTYTETKGNIDNNNKNVPKKKPPVGHRRPVILINTTTYTKATYLQFIGRNVFDGKMNKSEKNKNEDQTIGESDGKLKHFEREETSYHLPVQSPRREQYRAETISEHPTDLRCPTSDRDGKREYPYSTAAFSLRYGMNSGVGCNVCVGPMSEAHQIHLSRFPRPNAEKSVAKSDKLRPPLSLRVYRPQASDPPVLPESLRERLRHGGVYGFKYGWEWEEHVGPAGAESEGETSHSKSQCTRWYEGTTVMVRVPYTRHTTHFAESTSFLFHAVQHPDMYPWVNSPDFQRVAMLNVPANEMEWNKQWMKILLHALPPTVAKGKGGQGIEVLYGPEWAFDSENTLYCFEKAIFVGMASHEFGMFADSHEARMFRHHMWLTLNLPPPDPSLDPPNSKLRVLVVRRSGKRHMTNFAALRAMLEESGLVDMAFVGDDGSRFELMSARKQVDLMRNTDVLIGVHGAGLQNGLFMAENSVVIDVLPTNFVEYEWHNHLTSAGIRYLFLPNARMDATTHECLPFPPHCLRRSPYRANTMDCIGIRNCKVDVDVGGVEMLLVQASYIIRNIKRRLRRDNNGGLWGRGLRPDGTLEEIPTVAVYS